MDGLTEQPAHLTQFANFTVDQTNKVQVFSFIFKCRKICTRVVFLEIGCLNLLLFESVFFYCCPDKKILLLIYRPFNVYPPLAYLNQEQALSI